MIKAAVTKPDAAGNQIAISPLNAIEQKEEEKKLEKGKIAPTPIIKLT